MFSIKITNKELNDKRRVRLASASFDELEKAIVAAYGSGKFSVCYEDDEQDVVSLKSSEELEEAFCVVGNKTLKIFVTKEAKEKVAGNARDARDETAFKKIRIVGGGTPWKCMKKLLMLPFILYVLLNLKCCCCLLPLLLIPMGCMMLRCGSGKAETTAPLQTYLRTKGYNPGPSDGYWGVRTTTALQ